MHEYLEACRARLLSSQLRIIMSLRKSLSASTMAALLASSPSPCQPPASTVTVTQVRGTATSIETVSTVFAPSPTGDILTISITNQNSKPVSLTFRSNVNAPTPINDPTPTQLGVASPTSFLFPKGWAGNIVVGPNLNAEGSKIEGAFSDQPYIDVSYVDGFTVPVTCGVGNTTITGCNIDLFNQPGITCGEVVDGPLCLNPAKSTPAGPPDRFFSACAGAAYTFPSDDEAVVGTGQSREVKCCIGTACRAPARQPVSSFRKRAGVPW